ncbi:jg8046 [Pararge aegeria aegeria]|uniref:Jg8046 protein n=1 Tax=Pararge aegeria aegeria TaxID=348720 RepID=A0A8S4RGX9_9NEOP|nr:jg8046 [Pararge aegeria aegeria]
MVHPIIIIVSTCSGLHITKLDGATKILHRASEVFTKNAYIYNFQKLMFAPRSPSTITRSEEDLPIVTVERITIAPVQTHYRLTTELGSPLTMRRDIEIVFHHAGPVQIGDSTHFENITEYSQAFLTMFPFTVKASDF